MSTRARQKKSLSQVFLKDQWPCRLVAEELVKIGVTRVLEIGPGKGALTTELLAKGLSVTAVETDPSWHEWLQENLADERLDVVLDDFREYDLKSWLESHEGERLAIVGNIPYHISTAIVSKCLEEIAGGIPAFFLVQLEYAERLVAKPGIKAYGSLSIYTQLRARAQIIAKVPKTDFKPVPKVDSAVIQMAPADTQYPEAVLKQVEKYSRHAFLTRRKKLSNSLKPFLGDRDTAHCPVDLQARCDQLTLEEFVALANFLESSD